MQGDCLGGSEIAYLKLETPREEGWRLRLCNSKTEDGSIVNENRKVLGLVLVGLSKAVPLARRAVPKPSLKAVVWKVPESVCFRGLWLVGLERVGGEYCSPLRFDRTDERGGFELPRPLRIRCSEFVPSLGLYSASKKASAMREFARNGFGISSYLSGSPCLHH